jgi:hypothetical protein
MTGPRSPSSHLGLFSLLFPILSSSGFPGGAGGCAPNRAAVEGSHLATPARQTGPLGNGGLQVVLDDEIVLRSTQWTNFTVGEDHTLTLKTINDQGTPFRGFLFRLGPGDNSQVDTREALQGTTSDTSVAENLCVVDQGVGGLTHTDSELKDTVRGILRMDRVATNMPLDVTVVIQNRNGLSEFYYQQFRINAVTGNTQPGGPAPPTPSPVIQSVAPAPTPPATVPLPQQKVAPETKCGSIALAGNRGGAAAQAKDCASRNDGNTRRKLLKGDRTKY